MTERIFTREQFEAWDLPDAWADDAPEILHREQVGSRRWVSVNELVFRAPDDGKTYRVYYDKGLTESQDGTDPWNGDLRVKGTEVKQRAKTTMVWEDVSSASAPAEAPAKVTILPKVAAHVLWHEKHGGYEPGSFIKKLLALWAWADDANAAHLSASWPEYGAAIALMKQPNGVAELRAIAERP